MRTHHATRSSTGRATFDTFDFRAVGGPLPLHLHVRRWRADGVVASLLVYAPGRGTWFEGDDMPEDVRRFALEALAGRLGALPVFSDACGVRP